MGEVSDLLSNLDFAIGRAKKPLAKLRNSGVQTNVVERDLERFVSKWRPYGGSERSEAQSFLNVLYAAYGTDRTAAGAKFEDVRTSAGFMDLPSPVCSSSR